MNVASETQSCVLITRTFILKKKKKKRKTGSARRKATKYLVIVIFTYIYLLIEIVTYRETKV